MDNKKSKKKLEIEIGDEEEKTYIEEGICFGMMAGSVLGVILGMFTKLIYMPMCLCGGMMIGLAIGSCIKKDNKKK